MSEKTQKTNKGEKNMNKKINMNGVVITEITHNKTKYLLVKVIIPSNDHHFAIVIESGNVMTVKAVGIYAEDAFNYAIEKAKERGDDDEIERLYLLLGKFELDRWNGKLQS
jgi:hypothetical protein